MAAHNSRVFDGEAVADTGASPWFPLAQFREASVHIVGLGAGDEVDVEVSNEPEPTAGNAIVDRTVADENALENLSDIGANWVRFNISADGANGSELDAWFYGFRRET